MMKAYDTKFSKSHLVDCMNQSDDSAEICGLALKKIRALEKKIERLSAKKKRWDIKIPGALSITGRSILTAFRQRRVCYGKKKDR